MKKMNKLIFVVTLLFSYQLPAATITWGSSSTAAYVGDVFTIDIVGTGFTSNVDGGGVNFTYNSSVLNVLSVTIDETVWDFGGSGISTGTIDNIFGSVDGVMMNAVSDVTGSFMVASIEFQAVGAGNSFLGLTEYALNPWASGGATINPDFFDASVAVSVSSVPVPAAFWLFVSGLVGLLGRAKKKSV